jgi:hypothetical protein
MLCVVSALGWQINLFVDAVPRRAAGDKRAYDRLETEPGLDKFVGDAKGVVHQTSIHWSSCHV